MQFARGRSDRSSRSHESIASIQRRAKLSCGGGFADPLHPYIADFFVASHRLVIEVDGGVHRGREAYDAHRTSELERLYGVRVLRISAELVERELEAAVWLVRDALSRRV